MSGQLTPRMTVLLATVREPVEDVPDLDARPSFLAVRRAAIRVQAARVTRGMIRELVVAPPLGTPKPPWFARLDALQERYARLGGDPADLLR